MKRELCLQSVAALNRNDLIKKINSRGIFAVQPLEELEEEKSIILHGEEQSVKRRFQRLELKGKQSELKLSIRFEEGAVVTNDCIMRQNDIYFVYTEKSKEQLKLLLKLVLGETVLVLVEPDVYDRLKQNQGSFNPALTDRYKERNFQAGLGSHLFWQIFLVNQGWTDFLHKPLERITLRQLRVKVRRLRSCLTFFKPALRQDEALLWQNNLRRQGDQLAYLRELDVALMAIEKIKTPLAKHEEMYPEKLAELLWQARNTEAQRMKQELSLKDITLELAGFIIWLQGQPIAPAYANKELEPFLWSRIKEWSNSIASLTKRYPDFSNMLEMHKIRIKVKRFRYVMMTLPEINKNTGNMLRKLKKLQDILGFLHDEFINNEIISKIAATNTETLQCEMALFKGWESAKVEEAATALPDLWEDFCEELEIWEDTI